MKFLLPLLVLVPIAFFLDWTHTGGETAVFVNDMGRKPPCWQCLLIVSLCTTRARASDEDLARRSPRAVG